MKANTIMVSEAVNGTANLEFQKGRNYLAYIATSDTIITISDGAPFTLKVDNVWAPAPTPINALSFQGTGILITG